MIIRKFHTLSEEELYTILLSNDTTHLVLDSGGQKCMNWELLLNILKNNTIIQSLRILRYGLDENDKYHLDELNKTTHIMKCTSVELHSHLWTTTDHHFEKLPLEERDVMFSRTKSATKR